MKKKELSYISETYSVGKLLTLLTIFYVFLFFSTFVCCLSNVQANQTSQNLWHTVLFSFVIRCIQHTVSLNPTFCKLVKHFILDEQSSNYQVNIKHFVYEFSIILLLSILCLNTFFRLVSCDSKKTHFCVLK